MPRLSVLLVRAALLALLLGSVVGAILLATAPVLAARHPGLRSVHVTLMLFGWLVPFVLGTAFWMLPRHPGEAPRGPAREGRLAVLCYGVGVGLRVVGGMAGNADVLTVGTACLVTGGAAFVVQLWRRVKPFGAGRLVP